jgi:ribosomal protein S18 acetylase RimI-like enzyme
MPLPILNTARDARSPSDFVRLFHQTENRWCQHLGEEEQLDVGMAYTNPRLPRVYDANKVTDVSLPEGMTAEEAFEQVRAHYAERKVECYSWTINPSIAESQTKPLVDLLVARGHRAESTNLMVLDRVPPIRMPEVAGVKIIPARASFKHARMLFEENAARWDEPEVAEANMLHLDDPHWDALLALKDGQPVAHVGVLAVGEVGRIDNVYVAESHRRQGLGLLMMSRALEICARSVFKHVMLSVGPTNAPAVSLYAKVGFRKVADITAFFAPGTNLEPRPC